MTKFYLALTVFTLVTAIQPELRHGTLVVMGIPLQADYILVAAESRNVRRKPPDDDKACKVIALGGDTLFFETGLASADITGGASWNSLRVARAVYSNSKHHDVGTLTSLWVKRARAWFASVPQEEVEGAAKQNNDSLVTGGFATFDESGKPTIKQTEVYYRHEVGIEQRDLKVPVPGVYASSGVGSHIATEYFRANAPRLSKNANDDATVAKEAIQFTMLNVKGSDQRSLGGPIDVAVARPRQSIQWLFRKPECYAEDLTAK